MALNQVTGYLVAV